MSFYNPNVATFDDCRRDLTFLNPTNWKSYDVSWIPGTGTNAIGNGTLKSWYLTWGPMCFVSIQLIVGSTTTFGTGGWYFTLPVAVTDGPPIIGSVAMENKGIVNICGSCYVDPNFQLLFPIGPNGTVTSAYPHAWGTDDELNMTIWYPYRNG